MSIMDMIVYLLFNMQHFYSGTSHLNWCRISNFKEFQRRNFTITLQMTVIHQSIIYGVFPLLQLKDLTLTLTLHITWIFFRSGRVKVLAFVFSLYPSQNIHVGWIKCVNVQHGSQVGLLSLATTLSSPIYVNFHMTECGKLALQCTLDKWTKFSLSVQIVK